MFRIGFQQVVELIGPRIILIKGAAGAVGDGVAEADKGFCAGACPCLCVYKIIPRVHNLNSAEAFVSDPVALNYPRGGVCGAVAGDISTGVFAYLHGNGDVIQSRKFKAYLIGDGGLSWLYGYIILTAEGDDRIGCGVDGGISGIQKLGYMHAFYYQRR